MKLIIHTDGGARGNPGPAAVGVVIEITNDKLRMTNFETVEIRKRIGIATNNVAEYRGVIEALTYLNDHVSKEGSRTRDTEIMFFLDSTLVVNQLNGLFKVKDAHLRQLLMAVRALEGEVGGAIRYHAIPREQNTHADRLVNQALDEIR